ncbi:MAG: sugar phosphate isomerase/epimerase [Clostridia bacterium]|nr:sugar phosphate isomerase/epimerase [Clostridia bacterium]
MFKKLGFQMYTIRDYLMDADIADVALAKLKKVGYSEIHTAHMPTYIDDETLGALCKKNGIDIIGSHYYWDKIVETPEAVMDTHDKWGTKNVGIGGMPQAARTDLGELKAFIKQFNETAEIYAKRGFKLTYHHHNFEFSRIDGYKTIMDLLVEGFDPATTSFVLDTCWVSAGGGDVVDWMEKLAGRIDILHLKDMALKKEEKKFYPFITEVGHGNLSWDPIIKAAERIGVTNYVVEQDNNFTPDSLASLTFAANFLKKYMA